MKEDFLIICGVFERTDGISNKRNLTVQYLKYEKFSEVHEKSTNPRIFKISKYF